MQFVVTAPSGDLEPRGSMCALPTPDCRPDGLVCGLDAAAELPELTDLVRGASAELVTMESARTRSYLLAWSPAS